MRKIGLQELTYELTTALSKKRKVEIVIFGLHDNHCKELILDIQQLNSINVNVSLSNKQCTANFKDLHKNLEFTDGELYILVNAGAEEFKPVFLAQDKAKYVQVDSSAQHPLTGLTIEIENSLHFVRLLNVSIHDVLLKKFLPTKDKVHVEPDVLNRPWGEVNIYSEHNLSSLRVLSINKNSRLSFQRHVLRDEYFVALSDGVMLDICYKDIQSDTIDNKKNIITYSLNKGSSMYVKRGTWHRLNSPKDTDVEVMEVGYGMYDQVNDIERKEDDYGRKYNDGAI